jgi:hypothetical protein
MLTGALGVVLLIAPGLLQSPEVVLGLGVAPLALSLALTCPVVLCTLFIIVSHFRIHEAFPFLFPLHLPLVLAVLSLMSVFIQMVGGQVRFAWGSPLTFVTLLFICVVGSCITSTNWDTSFTALGDFSKIFMMTFTIAWLVREPKHFRFVTRAVIIGGASVALVAIETSVTGSDLVVGGRVGVGAALKSSIGDPNDLCFILLFAWSFALAIIVIRPNVGDSLLAFFATPMLLWAMVATKSRGGLLGMLAVFLIIGLQKCKSKLFLVMASVALVVALYLAMGIGERVESFDQGAAFDDSSQSRLNAWTAAIKMGISRPLSGVGFYTFSENLWMYKSERWVGYFNMVAHSAWLTVFAETGFFGFVAFAMMVATTWKACRENLIAIGGLDRSNALKVMSLGLMAGVAGFCASGTFLSQAFSWPIYIFVGLTVSLSNYGDQPARRNSAQLEKSSRMWNERRRASWGNVRDVQQ